MNEHSATLYCCDRLVRSKSSKWCVYSRVSTFHPFSSNVRTTRICEMSNHNQTKPTSFEQFRCPCTQATADALWDRRVAACRLNVLTQKIEEETTSFRQIFARKSLKKQCPIFSKACLTFRGKLCLLTVCKGDEIQGLRAITYSKMIVNFKMAFDYCPCSKGRQLSRSSSPNYPPNRPDLAFLTK